MECEGVQKPEAVSHLREDIALLLARWNGLQIAVKNQWGGRDSLQKFHQLAADILSWLFQSRGPLYVEDLENLLHESLLLSFNTEIEDGSLEEVAEQLIMMHEEYLHRSHYTKK
ncbi:pre-rRNA-processing protein TSR2 homolog [Ricinus communis]|uniref:pre-rRNA-processing protein TSR2 homolog n=1 Tax=Ricinus communis TaxID=3988 RepID=UPI0007726E64|nr:pre-rRNA-processing protein TSR2 homolog [Ricinus communis]|eukprot:XP_015573486.1 pre-rRNA-processing protein TSR2 homolog [Ricinus communis]